MLRIYQSNLIERLLAQLATVVARRPDNFPLLQSEQILVQNPDMEQWLKIELAEAHGVAANISFPLPSSFVWRIFHALFDDLPEQSPYSKPSMSWQLMQLLPQFRQHPEFGWMAGYFSEPGEQAEQETEPEAESEADEKLQQRLFQLCGSIADTFDQYLMYRPDWIAAWEQGDNSENPLPAPPLPADQRWQPLLWRALSEAISKRHGSAMHRAELLQRAIDKLNSGEPLELTGFPPRICLFGISSLPEQTLLLLGGLANHLELHWFQHNPCREFWLDIIDEKSKARLAAKAEFLHLDDLEEESYFLVGNPLLASMGTQGREHLSLMYEQLAGDLDEQYSDFPAGGALGALQNEIHHLHCRGQFESLGAEQLDSNQGKLVFSPAELDNLQLHSCYSPMREVEVLKDQLLALFDRDPTLTPNDVMVMMPDVAAYAPAVHAVFSGIGDGQRLPYSINDLSAVQESPLVDALFTLLSLPESRLPLSEVLGVLEVPAVMRRFGLSADELELIKQWLSEVGVRWGLDSEHRAALGTGGFSQNSWYAGLRRMLAGYAIHPAQGVYDDTLPYLEIEGSAAEALGKLLMFVDTLQACRSQLAATRTAEQWQAFISQLITHCFAPEDQEVALLQRAREAMQALSDHCHEVGFDGVLSRLIVREQLEQQLSTPLGGRRFRAGAINFCTLMPMRTIPFKVVALLGMSDGAYPRQDIASSFDLMAAQRRRGDRSRRLDDRYLFLEALLACREHLHISWVGRDIRSDGELPPSVLVSELMDYLMEAWMLEADNIAQSDSQQTANNLLEAVHTEHPLQPFNPAYFTPGSPLFSYSRMWADSLPHSEQAAPADFISQPLPEPEWSDGQPVIELRQLEGMFLNPCQAFMQRRLGIYFDQHQQESEDSEPFESDALQQWQLKDDALGLQLGLSDTGYDSEALHSGALQSGPLAGFIAQHQLSGSLPVGESGRRQLLKAIEDPAELAQFLRRWLPADPTPREVRVILSGGVVIAGALPSASPVNQAQHECQDVVIQIKVGSIKPKDRLRGWLRHLVNCAAGHQQRWLLVDNSQGILWQPLAQQAAQEELERLLALYREGLTRPLAFFVQSGFKLMELIAKGSEPADCLAELERKWLPDDYNPTAEGGDPYIQRCYPALAPAFEELCRLSQQLLTPLTEHICKVPGRGGKMKETVALDKLTGVLEGEA